MIKIDIGIRTVILKFNLKVINSVSLDTPKPRCIFLPRIILFEFQVIRGNRKKLVLFPEFFFLLFNRKIILNNSYGLNTC
jgi:hypothetical protein